MYDYIIFVASRQALPREKRAWREAIILVYGLASTSTPLHKNTGSVFWRWLALVVLTVQMILVHPSNRLLTSTSIHCFNRQSKCMVCSFAFDLGGFQSESSSWSDIRRQQWRTVEPGQSSCTGTFLRPIEKSLWKSIQLSMKIMKIWTPRKFPAT